MFQIEPRGQMKPYYVSAVVSRSGWRGIVFRGDEHLCTTLPFIDPCAMFREVRHCVRSIRKNGGIR